MSLAQSAPLPAMATPPPQHAPPYSPTLINLNQQYNMSANSLTEALLLLSGMYISMVHPEPGPVEVGLHAIFPMTMAPFRNAVTDPFSPRSYQRTLSQYRNILPKFNITSAYTRSEYTPKELLDMLCDEVFPKNVITIIYLNNHLDLQEYRAPTVRYLPRIIESLGLPIISYDTQFSVNARPELSLQLAPTMGQMMDVVFSFLKRFSWTHFSFLCTLSYGCEDEYSIIKLKVEESQRRPNVTIYGVDTFSYHLLSYVNITDGRDAEEVREKLKYQLDQDTRIIFVHGDGAEVKSILDVAKELGLTGEEYVWIFTSASISLSGENSVVSRSYPLGSFIIGFDATRNDMDDIVKTSVNLWLDALNNLAGSSEYEHIDFHTDFSCGRTNHDTANSTSNQSALHWPYGEVLYQYLLKSKLPGDLEFDEQGILKANKFWIMNVQLEEEDTSSFGGRSSIIGGGTRRQGGFLTGRSPDRGLAGLSRTSEAGRPSSPSRNGDSGSPFSRDRDSGSPFSRDRDSGSPFSRDRDSGSPFSRDRDSGSPFSRDRDSGSPFSRDRDSGSPFSRDRDSGSPFSRDRDSGSPFSRGRDRDSGSPFSRGRDSDSPFSRERNGDQDEDSTTADLSENPSSKEMSSSSPIHTADNNMDETDDGTTEMSSAGSSLPATDSSKNTKSSVGKRDSWKTISETNDEDSDNNAVNQQGNGRSLRSSWRSGASGHAIRHGGKLRSSRGGHTSSDNANDHQMDDDPDGKRYRTRRDVRQSRRRSRLNRALGRKQIAKKIADWNGHNLTVEGITWPGGAATPPKGKPEKYILRVATWREDPHVIYTDMKNDTEGQEELCDANSLPCTVYIRDQALRRIGNETEDKCCTGLCIDLLKRLSDMLHFEVQLFEVANGTYGSPVSKDNLSEWNGMLGMVLHGEADLAMGALSITPERSAAVDFSVPFLQTGITIIVAIREGAISPTAFLEPYDYPSWSLILVFSVHATGASIFIFEWLSPYGLDQGKTPLRVHKFSLFRSFWLIWAMLFGASVSTDQPRGCASRFLANIWALFAVVFCASYTANLAAFMITKDDYYDLSGIQDWRLRNPNHIQPPFKFATIKESATDLNIAKNHEEIHKFMKQSEQLDVKDAIKELKKGDIQAFIYDSTTLEYEVGKDTNCKLKTVGKRIAETGYGIAFPRKSQWVKHFDRALLRLQEDGEIERLQKFWLAGACHKKKETGVSSHTLGILNFTSAFILLGGGVILGVLLLILEHMYFLFGRKSLKKWDKCGCCSLVSLSMGQSLTFEQSVMEAIDFHRHHKCKDPLCETQLWKVKHELDIALLKISQLRKQIAHAASMETERRLEDEGTLMPKQDTDAPYQNGSARRRRQQPSDAGAMGTDPSANQPLLALSDRQYTDDDETPAQSPKHWVPPPSSRASFPAAKNKMASPESEIPLQTVRHSYPDQHSPRSEARRTSNGGPASKAKKGNGGGRQTVADLDLHPPPPSFDEVYSGYDTSPEHNGRTPSPSLPLPPPPDSPPPHSLLTPQQSPQHDPVRLSDSNASNSLPSSEDKRFEPFILDSPDSPSSSTFSEVSDANRLPSPGTLSKISGASPSSAAASPDRKTPSSTASPDVGRSIDERNALPQVAYAPDSSYSSTPSKQPSSSTVPSKGDSRQSKPELPPKSSKEDDNDVSVRRQRDRDGNVYVNVDEIKGKETAF